MEATLDSALPNKSTNVQSKPSTPNEALLDRWRRRLKFVEKVSPSLAARLAVEVFTSTRRHARPEREQQLLAKATELHIDRSFAAWSFGEGPLVLLVHGWEGRGAQLGAFVEPLVAAGYRVVTFDAPAHGSSPGRVTSLAGFVEPMLKLKWNLGEVHAVVAHSFGCAGVCAALTRGLAPKGVVFVAPVTRLEAGFEQFGELMQLEAGTVARMRTLLEARAGRSLDSVNPFVVARQTAVPLTIFHDRSDREVPWQGARALAEAWPNANFKLTDGLNHYRILRDKDVVEDAVEFIKAIDQEQPELERRLIASGL